MKDATLRLINAVVMARELPFPFDFLATQPILAVIAARQVFSFENMLYQPWSDDTELHWRQMRDLAAVWLGAGRCERVLCGEVEPTENGVRGQWQIVEKV
jgi:hypothetical protein